jgi:hypothetical protein
MTRRKEFSQSSPMRYKGKLKRVFDGVYGAEFSVGMADTTTEMWLSKTKHLFDGWKVLRDQLIKQFPDIKRTQYGIIRSIYLRMAKAKIQGGNLDALVDYYESISDIPRSVLEAIKNFVGQTV